MCWPLLLFASATRALLPPRTPRLCSRGAVRTARPLATVANAATDVDVLIAGGGPCGLAAALSFAKAGFSVRVVERRQCATEFETQRAYLYLLDRRGQRFTDTHHLTDVIRERGVSNDGYTITRAWPDARGAITSKPLLAQEATASAIWIPRAALLDVLAKAAVDAGATLSYGSSLDGLKEGGESERVQASVTIGESSMTLAPRLLLACDGAGSRVRRELAKWSGGIDGGDFTPVRLRSPSSGLQYKMLLVPPTFALRNLSSAAVDPIVWTEHQVPLEATSKPSRNCHGAHTIVGAS